MWVDHPKSKLDSRLYTGKKPEMQYKLNTLVLFFNL